MERLAIRRASCHNTILFVSGDNGGNLYFADKEHPDGIYRPNVDPRTGQRFRGHKGNFYEGGLRVPFLVRWPGHGRAGTVSDHLGYWRVGIVDCYRKSKPGDRSPQGSPIMFRFRFSRMARVTNANPGVS